VLSIGGSRLGAERRQDGRPLLEQSLEIYRELNMPRGMIKVLNRLGYSHIHSGTPELGLLVIKEALAIAQQHGYVAEIAESKVAMGGLHASLGQLDEAERVLREALALQPHPDHGGTIYHRVALDFIRLLQGKYEDVHQGASKNLAFSRDFGHKRLESGMHNFVNESLLHLGRYELARQQVIQALPLIREIGLKTDESSLVWILGRLALLDSSYDEAKVWIIESAEVAVEIQERQCFAQAGLGYVSVQQGLLDEARQHLVEALSCGLGIHVYYPLIFTVPGVALFLAAVGAAVHAVEVWALAKCHPYVANSKWFEDVAGRELEALAASLPPEVAEAAWERGRTLDLWEEAAVLLAELEAMNS
jgi:tetratricopeptide (TPR) repeat protein